MPLVIYLCNVKEYILIRHKDKDLMFKETKLTTIIEKYLINKQIGEIPPSLPHQSLTSSAVCS